MLLAVGMATATHGQPSSPQDDGLALRAPAPELPDALTIVLLGDSYTAGNGARDADGNRSYYGPSKCMRSADTWGEQYARSLADQGVAVTLLNRACSAATTENMLNERYLKRTEVVHHPEAETPLAPLPDAHYTEWAAGIEACQPVPNSEEFIRMNVLRDAVTLDQVRVSVTCEHWIPAQVDALNPDVDLVFFTVGGNDAKFPDVMRECLVMHAVSGCEQALAEGERFEREEFAGQLARVFDEIHARTEGNAKVVYLGYPRVELHEDAVLTSIDDGQVRRLEIGTRLGFLMEAGEAAQHAAVDAANARYGDGFVTFLDDLDDLFRGHEPDARPTVMNPDRWIAEAFETTVIDEWYHFLPAGHEAIARHVAQFGTFGAGRDAAHAGARDVAVVTDGTEASLGALAGAPSTAFAGASLSLVTVDGSQSAPQVVATGVDGTWLREWARAQLLAQATSKAAPGPLAPRWNASSQVLFVGDASRGLPDLASIWGLDPQGRLSEPAVSVVDLGPAPVVTSDDVAYRWAPHRPADALAAADAALAEAPHAWAGGQYVGHDGLSITLDARGSFSGALGGELHYTWDVDGADTAGLATDSPMLTLPAERVAEGWITVTAADVQGRTAVSHAYVGKGDGLTNDGSAACANAKTATVIESVTGTPAGARSCQPHGSTWGWGWEADVTDGATPASLTSGSEPKVLELSFELQLVPIERETRSLTVAIRRGLSGSAANSRGRVRPRELVERERGLSLLWESVVV